MAMPASGVAAGSIAVGAAAGASSASFKRVKKLVDIMVGKTSMRRATATAVRERVAAAG